LDDGFQHRRLARDFDLVLVDACAPFGFGHVIPRGLLREPLVGLRRADAILITRADQGDAAEVERTVRRFNPTAPVYRCAHAHVGLRRADGSIAPIDELADRRFFAFAGIGNPDGLRRQLERAAKGGLAGTAWFGDHWDYTRADLDDVMSKARTAGAKILVTTEKDWVKIKRLVREADLPVARLELAVKFENPEDERQLLERIEARAKPPEVPPAAPGPNHSGKWVVVALFVMAAAMAATAVMFAGGKRAKPRTTAPSTTRSAIP
jgi:tetraacyldisaccharide 4'-kinase